MIDRRAEYFINKSKYIVQYADLATVNAEALVSSDDNYLSMSGGVSAALLHAGGEEISQAAQKCVPVPLGDVAVTTAGKLRARFIFHVITIDYDQMILPSEEVLRSGTRKCLSLCESLGLKTIAFPALGTGVGGFSFAKAAEVMTKTIADHLLSNTIIKTVTLTLLAREGITQNNINTFYENAVNVASLLSQSRQLNGLLAELEKHVSALHQPTLLQRMRDLASDLQRAQQELDRHPDSPQELVSLPQKSGIQEATMAVMAVASAVGETVGHGLPEPETGQTKELELTILRTRLNGLLTQLNIKYGNLNKLEQKAAQYGANFEVPLVLENSIGGIKQEISESEAQIAAVRKEISQVAFGARS